MIDSRSDGFSGIIPKSNETCTNVAVMEALHLPGETEAGTGGTQPNKGFSGLPYVNAAFDLCRLTLAGKNSSMPLVIGAKTKHIHTRMIYR